MIKVLVDMEKCQHYGQCVFEAPNIFKLNTEDRLEYLATAEDFEKANAYAKKNKLPIQIIFIAKKITDNNLKIPQQKYYLKKKNWLKNNA